MKFGTRVRLKPSNDRGEFELDWAKSRNNIAENSFALGHETDNTITNAHNVEMCYCCIFVYVKKMSK